MSWRRCRRFLHDVRGPAPAASWYPGHMSSSLRSMQDQYLSSVHVVVEVRDARLPLTSSSSHLEPLVASKRRLIVLNKSDLADLSHRRRLQDAIRRRCRDRPQILFASRRDHHALLPAIVDAAADRSRFRTTPRLVMVVGVPNVGKSSIIRGLKRDRKSVQVGAKPGVTRSVSRLHLVGTGPDLYLLDTPGILAPSLGTDLDALKLSLVHALPEHVVGNYRTGQYLHGIVAGADPGPGAFHAFLSGLARHRAFYLSSTGELDLDRAVQAYLGQFRQGQLGRFMLDQLD